MLHAITMGDTPLLSQVLLMMSLLGQVFHQPQLDVSLSRTRGQITPDEYTWQEDKSAS